MITDNWLTEINFKMFFFGSDAVCSLVIQKNVVYRKYKYAQIVPELHSITASEYTSWFLGKFFFLKKIIFLFLSNRVIVKIQIWYLYFDAEFWISGLNILIF